MHYQYSNILLQIYMALMYGMFVPMLYPIVLLSIFNLYICEKIMLVYICKQVPNYDDHLARQAIYLLKWAPACSLILGYWAISNTQFFFN